MASPYAFASVDSTTVAAYSKPTVLTAAQITAIKTPITASIDADFLTDINQAEAGSMNSMTYGMLLARNQTIADTANSLANKNLQVTQGGASDTYARQAEINEWEAQNKLDALFFLQVLFIYFAIITGLLYARKYAGIPANTFYIFFSILTLILVGIIWNRAAYTTNSRDKRYWNRRFIGLTDAGSGLKANASCS
jgi:hypothetical protein